METKTKCLLLILLILPVIMLSYVSAETDPVEYSESYPYLGFNDYRADEGGFFGNDPDYSSAFRYITSPSMSPLIADLDQDGTLEIIVFDGDNMRLYHGAALDIVDSFATGLGNSNKTAWVGNLDADEYLEVVVAEQEGDSIIIMQYNGSLISSEKAFDFPMTSSDYYKMVTCDEDSQDCVIVGTGGGGATTYQIKYGVFNLSGDIYFEEIDSDNFHQFCLPKIPSISYGIVSPNGSEKFVFTYAEYHGEIAFKYTLLSLKTNSSGNDTISDETFETDDIPSVAGGCEYAAGRFTSPLILDIDSSLSNGEEVVFGAAVNDDSFRLFSYDYKGDKISQYPLLTDGEGILISNPVVMNAFPDTGIEDFCVLGFDTEDDMLDLLCGSEGTGLFGTDKSTTFSWDVPVNYSKPMNGTYQDITLMASQQYYETTGGVNLDEISSFYGVFKLDFTAFDELELLFAAPYYGSILMNDAENVGASDMIIFGDNAIYYIDDGYTNQPVAELEYTVNPCIEQTWKVTNASNDNVTREVFISMTPTDGEGDQVSARAILYADSIYEQDSNWSNFTASGTNILNSFIITDNTAYGILRLQAMDYINQDEEDWATIDLAFSVSTNGVEFGDCATSSSVINTPEAEAAEEEFQDLLETDQTDNAIYNTLGDIAELTGLGLKVLWLLILVITSIIVISNFQNKAEAFWAVGFVWVAGLILGTYLGFIPTAVIVIFVACALIVAAIIVWKLFSGKS